MRGGIGRMLAVRPSRADSPAATLQRLEPGRQRASKPDMARHERRRSRQMDKRRGLRDAGAVGSDTPGTIVVPNPAAGGAGLQQLRALSAPQTPPVSTLPANGSE